MDRYVCFRYQADMAESERNCKIYYRLIKITNFEFQRQTNAAISSAWGPLWQTYDIFSNTVNDLTGVELHILYLTYGNGAGFTKTLHINFFIMDMRNIKHFQVSI